MPFGPAGVGLGGMAGSGVVRGKVVFVDGDMEAGLLEFFFHVDLAGGFDGEQVAAHPGHLGAAQVVFGNVDGGAGKVRADNVAQGRRGVAVYLHQSLLVLNRSDCGADFKRPVELCIVRCGEVGEESRGPGAAIAVIGWQVAVDDERIGGRYWNKKVMGNAGGEIVFVLDAFEPFSFKPFVLALE